METKKNPQANLENKRVMFFEIGLIFALAIIFGAFEWTTSVKEKEVVETTTAFIAEEEVIPVTQQQMKPPPPPPPAPKITDLIDIVEDEISLDDDLDLTNIEDDTDNHVFGDNTDYTGGGFGTESTGEEDPFVVVEEMPKPFGNVTAWIAKYTKYPPVAQENGVQGKVTVQYVVEKDGSISNVKVLKGVDPSLDKEAVRVVSSMPKWTPGKQRNKPVRVFYTLPVVFKINNY